jgi:hypothetical protein
MNRGKKRGRHEEVRLPRDGTCLLVGRVGEVGNDVGGFLG